MAGGIGVAVVVALLVIAAFLGRKGLRSGFSRVAEQTERAVVIRRFLASRKELERVFFEMAAASGKPKGLRWEQCDFQPETTFVLDKMTGEPTAFVETTIRFSAIEGGGMEEVQAVGNLRHATAVFHFHAGNWGTGGRALFNMTPGEAVRHFAAQYELLPEEASKTE